MSQDEIRTKLEQQLSGHVDRLEALQMLREGLNRELRAHPDSTRLTPVRNRGELKEITDNPPFDPKTFVKKRSATAIAFELDLVDREMLAHATAIKLARDPRVL